jgi:hypothetical protein
LELYHENLKTMILNVDMLLHEQPYAKTTYKFFEYPWEQS